jgi:hypothetical protein
MKKLSVSGSAFVVLAGLFATFGPPAFGSTTNVCPPGGVSNTTYNGGLLVTNNNYCTLDHVTVNGGITVRSGSDVDLEDATVNGGVSVEPGGEIEVDPGSVFGDDPAVSTIRGGIVLHGAVDWDIETAHISGGVRINGGPASVAQPTFCGNSVTGSVRVSNVSAEVTWFGDPNNDEFFDCEGNAISGSLLISNSSFLEVEGNRIGGSVTLRASTLEFNGNIVGGSLLCSNGTAIETGEDGDPSGNTVHGTNTC